jgi:hypothetical protein
MPVTVDSFKLEHGGEFSTAMFVTVERDTLLVNLVAQAQSAVQALSLSGPAADAAVRTYVTYHGLRAAEVELALANVEEREGEVSARRAISLIPRVFDRLKAVEPYYLRLWPLPSLPTGLGAPRLAEPLTAEEPPIFRRNLP